jgi:hypothetical protein
MAAASGSWSKRTMMGGGEGGNEGREGNEENEECVCCAMRVKRKEETGRNEKRALNVMCPGRMRLGWVDSSFLALARTQSRWGGWPNT